LLSATDIQVFIRVVHSRHFHAFFIPFFPSFFSFPSNLSGFFFNCSGWLLKWIKQVLPHQVGRELIHPGFQLFLWPQDGMTELGSQYQDHNYVPFTLAWAITQESRNYSWWSNNWYQQQNIFSKAFLLLQFLKSKHCYTKHICCRDLRLIPTWNHWCVPYTINSCVIPPALVWWQLIFSITPCCTVIVLWQPHSWRNSIV
jgi:hypothetical protein